MNHDILFLQYSQRYSVTKHCDRHITLHSDNYVTFVLFNLKSVYLLSPVFWMIVSNTLNTKENFDIY
jgi:hypothetical protein